MHCQLPRKYTLFRDQNDNKYTSLAITYSLDCLMLSTCAFSTAKEIDKVPHKNELSFNESLSVTDKLHSEKPF